MNINRRLVKHLHIHMGEIMQLLKKSSLKAIMEDSPSEKVCFSHFLYTLRIFPDVLQDNTIICGKKMGGGD